MADFKTVTNCRVCGSERLKKYLDLGKAPLANALLNTPSSQSEKYPLQVLFCEDCSLSQLSIVVKPEILYSNYPYHSSVSKTFQEHCRKMAIEIKKYFESLPGKPLVVDIASNDGCLLEQFQLENYYVMGVEPSKNLAEESIMKGISTINEFWSEKTARRIPACDVITATNVFAHVDDLRTFLKAAKGELRVYSKGILVVEVPYLYDLISKVQFDTIYHEHLSYFLFKPLKRIFSECGLNIFNVERHEIHGGSLRVYATPYDRPINKSVKALEAFEKKNKLYDFKTYLEFASKVEEIRDYFVDLLQDLRRQRKKVMAYGASAKGAMLLNYCGVDSNQISSVVDDTKDKQGKYMPGSRIPIVDQEKLDSNKPDYIALLSWNFSDEIINKTLSHKDRGAKYIIPVPTVSVL